MKRYIIALSVLYIILLLIPLPLINGEEREKKAKNKKENTSQTSPTAKGNDVPENKPDENEAYFQLLETETGNIIKLSEKDFIIGTVSAEMYPTYHIEAIKAQAIAAYTYYSVQRNKQQQNPNPDLKGADVADVQSGVVIYRSNENLKSHWGENYQQYYEKTSAAVNDVIGKRILYNSEPIIAVYHSINSGITEDAEVIWGADYPYLKPVASPSDMLSPDYESNLSLTADEFKEKIYALTDEVVLGENPQEWLGENIQKSSSGTVTEIIIGGKAFTGRQIREALGLRSACFEINYTEGNFVFAVFGYGHGVGMSQYGADYMARQGWNYQDIIKAYYTNVIVE